LLFICAYKAWVISSPGGPHPLPYHSLRPLSLPSTPSIPSRNYFALISNFTTTDFSKQTLTARRAWNDIIQALIETSCPPILVFSAKLSLIIEGKVKTFHSKQKLNEFMITKPALQKRLKRIIHTEEEDRRSQENTEKNKYH
jgi:hypothetical protein